MVLICRDVYSRTFSLVRRLKPFPNRAFVRHLFGNAEERQEKREKILAELRKGYLSDLKEVKATGGKRYLALNEPFPIEDSTALPTIEGFTVAGNAPVKLPQDVQGSVALLLLWTREHGQNTCDIYRNAFSDEFKTNQHTKCFEVNVIDSWLFRMMRSFIDKNLQKQIPFHRQKNFLCCYEGTSQVIHNLFENTLVGHAILLDHTGRVRWKAHGPPTDEELSYLVNCTNILCNKIPRRDDN